MKSSSAASFWPPATMPNSDACLIALVVSPPALASPTTFAFEDCACSRKDEKSDELIGCFTPPSTLPPLAGTTAGGSRSHAWAEAESDGWEEQGSPPALVTAFPGALGRRY